MAGQRIIPFRSIALRTVPQQLLSTPSGGRAASEGDVPWLRNTEFNAERKTLNTLSAVWIAFCFVLGGVALLQGVLPAAMFMFMFAFLMPIVFVLTSLFRNRFFVPYHVRILDDSALLLYSGARTQRVLWKEVEPPVEVRSLDDWHLNKTGEILLFRTRGGRHRLFVENRIAKGIKESYEAWHASLGQAETIFLDKRLPLDRIIAGEGSRAIGYGYVIMGVLAMLFVLGSAYILAGFTNMFFTVGVFVMAFTLLGFFALNGLAEITSKPRYVKHSLVALYVPTTLLVMILAIGTMDRLVLITVVFLVISVSASYALIWRKISKSEVEDSHS